MCEKDLNNYPFLKDLTIPTAETSFAREMNAAKCDADADCYHIASARLLHFINCFAQSGYRIVTQTENSQSRNLTVTMLKENA